MDLAAARSALDMLQRQIARRDRDGVNRASQALIDGGAPLGRQWKSVAAVLQHHGEHRLARRAAALWTQQTSESAEARFEEAAVLAKSGKLADAARILELLPAEFPSTTANAYLRGTIAVNRGHVEQARHHLLAAVAADPAAGQAWLALAMAARTSADDAAMIEAAADAISLAPPLERSAWLYALGKARADQDRAGPAFAAISEGANLMRTLRRYDDAADANGAQAAILGWTADAIPSFDRDSRAGATESPMFVTGLPRSGTTLVEQILTAHSAVAGGDELGLLRLVAQDAGGVTRQQMRQYQDRGGSIDALRALYDDLARQRFEAPGRIVDKTLNASRYMGLIATIFPDAPVVWLRRDPLDCAWSAYRNWFARGADWSWSLTDIATHFRIEDQLHRYWCELLGDRILTLDYAELVEAPAAAIARLCHHCGLEMEPAMLRPQDNQRTVTTASVAQVREPINRRGLGSAAPVAPLLQPFIDAYDGGAELTRL